MGRRPMLSLYRLLLRLSLPRPRLALLSFGADELARYVSGVVGAGFVRPIATRSGDGRAKRGLDLSLGHFGTESMVSRCPT